MKVSMTTGRRTRDLIRTALVVLLLGTGMAAAEAAARGHRGTGYGIAGGINPDLALGSVYSGIYGLDYTYDRANYDFDRCPRSAQGRRDRPIFNSCRE